MKVLSFFSKAGSTNTQLFAQLASNFTTFFVKLGSMLLNLLQVFPRYDEMLQTVKHRDEACKEHGPGDFEEVDRPTSSTRIRTHIIAVYETLFHVLQVTARVFTKADGSKFMILSLIN